MAIGARFEMKSMKPRPAAPPIIMFGGSPTSVAVPPMFDANISESMNGIGFALSALVSSSVMGIMRSIVVTLSRNAERKAVRSVRLTSIFHAFPPAALAVRYATT